MKKSEKLTKKELQQLKGGISNSLKTHTYETSNNTGVGCKVFGGSCKEGCHSGCVSSCKTGIKYGIKKVDRK